MTVDLTEADQAVVAELLMAIDGLVPLWLLKFSQMSAEQRASRADRLADEISGRVDVLVYHRAKGKSARKARAATLSALAESVALGALQPGGVTLFGRHWETAVGSGPAADAAPNRAGRPVIDIDLPPLPDPGGEP